MEFTNRYTYGRVAFRISTRDVTRGKEEEIIKAFLIVDKNLFAIRNHSSLTKSKRETAWCLCLITDSRKCTESKENEKKTFLTTRKLNIALLKLIKITQIQVLSEE